MDISIARTQSTLVAIEGALLAWADATTDPTSARRHDLLRDKMRALTDFFVFVGKPVDQVKAADVKAWQFELEQRDLAPATIYAMVSRVSSFYAWAMQAPEVSGRMIANPVILARPKAPKPYQTESVKALDDNQIRALLRVVKARADADDIIGKRDYALLLFYLLTGMRRAEVARLRWGDLRIVEDGLIVSCKVKGGEVVSREVRASIVKFALLAYLQASGRLEGMTPSSPLWLRHDRAGQPGKRISTHGIAKNFAKYADEAEISGFYIHRLRHSFGRIVADEAASLAEVQEALGHKNQNTTRVYVQRIAVKRDKFSTCVARKFIIEK